MNSMEAVIARKVPFEAVINRKSGGKLLMNIAYYLDRQNLPDDPSLIEQNNELRWARLRRDHAREGVVQVTLFRNPAHRFASFYFEKIYGVSPQNWRNWREDLGGLKFDFEAGEHVNKHQRNALILLDYIGEKIEKHGLYAMPDQIAPQSKYVLPAQDFGFEAIEYSLANAELAERLRPFAENIDDVIMELGRVLYAPMPIDADRFIAGALAKRIEKIYAIDFDFFEALRYGTT